MNIRGINLILLIEIALAAIIKEDKYINISIKYFKPCILSIKTLLSKEY